MKYNPAIHHRRSIRLKDYDYSKAGAYFITTCIQGRECLLGKIKGDSVELSQYGDVVEQVWQMIPTHFRTVDIDSSVIMPNHFHGILIISDCSQKSQVGTDSLSSKTKNSTLGQIVAYFKYQTTKHINTLQGIGSVKVWQRNYYEHIIRNEKSLTRLREYIDQNPKRWSTDQLHPQSSSKW